ncbi:DegT/DnrJ/EryC1/StrS family aminotransferase [Oscillatoria sp. CS-180]|uniref:DegT/DnrJ/EryC1/StrS family aminotransferase n=1 Tax=Oscillatoria sp. CS-180 TaxID=3021720 RepID=UPI00232E33C6|nr:DegT/DnrJ/EryC1/StrS family aminotransferase [Oscillatoria sp. CS-180]MDB9527588.1 DegT/DnrJ/EryC1/StrS family aminotransferase [Oscillatoria sp. CS-180]
MIPRKRLDIAWMDLLFGLGCCLKLENRQSIESQLEQALPRGAASLTCLSVRSGFDALLQALAFEPGTEILVSAVTIRGMTRIIEAHNLIPVPVDLDFAKLALHSEGMAKAVTPRTKAILVAHLFGSRMPMEPILQFAQVHNLLVIEDCAQAYAGKDYWGHPQTDVSLFSFGPIKTATALAGGILRFREASLCEAVRSCQNRWPVQSRLRFAARIGKYSLLMLLSYRLTYSLFIGICSLFGKNHDRIISKSVRGFPGDDFFAQIRQRPSAPLLSLLARRLKQFNPESITRRIEFAEQLVELAPSLRRPGKQASAHTHWVFPILCAHPEKLKHYLWSKGFDATQGGSNLYVVDPPANCPDLKPTEARQIFQRLLYLPTYSGVTSQDIERLAHALNEYEACSSD